MAPKLAACEQCRVSKLACDHLRPSCSRCRETNRANVCTYRDRPFKRQRVGNSTNRSDLTNGERPSRSTATAPRYPNPGYLGSSSHASIYSQLPPGNSVAGLDTPTVVRETGDQNFSKSENAFDEVDISQGAQFIERIQGAVEVSSCVRLLDAWTEQGVNLALAGQFTRQCSQTAESTLSTYNSYWRDALSTSKNLYLNSCGAVSADVATPVAFSDQFCSENARWETLGLFFTATCRATNDVLRWTGLYNTKEERVNFQKLAMRFSDGCLDIALSLDCLNDVQLMLQYENFIMHAFVDGDQSYHSYRRLGDVISSLFALGYHERVDIRGSTETFLKDLRRTAFARAYSADKNVSIFLGRPPRLHKRYCDFKLPGYEQNNSADHNEDPFNWISNDRLDYRTDTRWSAICATLKEDILDVGQEGDTDDKRRKTEFIRTQAERQWSALPVHFRLEGPLKLCQKMPAEKDLMASMRLNYLHVLFLLHSTMVPRISGPDNKLIEVAVDMLSLTVETMVQKDHLANSGTGLVWRVAYYGLPAAGFVCLALLNNTFQSSSAATSLSQVFQDLSVLVAEVECGTFVHVENPNYALLAGAARTIKSILNRVITSRASDAVPNTQSENHGDQAIPVAVDDGWSGWPGHDLWDFDMEFWTNLADHPFLSTMDVEATGF